jgi:RNA polymerase sigma factor (sigma-70 family)
MENKIIQKVLEGNIDAFRYFVDQYKDMAYSITMSMTRDALLSEEIVQDAFLKAFQKLGQFRGESKFSTWFYTIVVNEVRIKMRKKKLSTLSLEREDLNESDISEVNQAVFNLQHDDQKQIINSTLSKLSPQESLLIRLFYLNDNSIEEIHTITRLNRSNIKTILHRARKHFYSILMKEMKDEAITLL